MTTIADASGDISTTWPWPVLIFAIAVAAVIYGFYAILTNPVPPLDPQETDTADPAPCAQRGGHYYRLDPTRTYYQCADTNCGHRVNRSGGEL